MGNCLRSKTQHKAPYIIRCHTHKRPDELPSNWDARRDLATACRGLYYYGIGMNDAMFNHAIAVAKKKDGSDFCYIMVKFGELWKDVTPDSIVEFDPSQGEKAYEDLNMPDTPIQIITALQKHRPDCIAVFHCHPTNALSLSCTKNAKLENLNMSFMELCQDIAYYPSKIENWDILYDDWFTWIGQKHILWLMNHGVTTIGHSIAQASEKMIAMEQAATVQVRAMSTGRRLKPLSSGRVQQLIELLIDSYPDHAPAHLESQRPLLPLRFRNSTAYVPPSPSK